MTFVFVYLSEFYLFFNTVLIKRSHIRYKGSNRENTWELFITKLKDKFYHATIGQIILYDSKHLGFKEK